MINLNMALPELKGFPLSKFILTAVNFLFIVLACIAFFSIYIVRCLVCMPIFAVTAFFDIFCNFIFRK